MSNEKFPPNRGNKIPNQKAENQRAAWKKANPDDTQSIGWGIDFLLENIQQAKANGATAAFFNLAKNGEGKTTANLNFCKGNGNLVSMTSEANSEGESLNDPFLCPPVCPCPLDNPDCKE